MVPDRAAKKTAEERKQSRINYEATQLSAAQRNIHIYAQIASIGNFTRKGNVCPAWCRIAAWVIMNKDEGA